VFRGITRIRWSFPLAAILLCLGCRSHNPSHAPAQAGHPPAVRPATFCNPLDLSYRFCLDAPSRREAADPTLVKFKGEYWLFASKSGGYWHSPDLVHWKLIVPTGLPIEDYAPTVEVIGGRMYYTAFNTKAMFTTDDPLAGAWVKTANLPDYPDPDLFCDDDGRVYMYFGCSYNGNIQVAELDPHHEFKVVRGPVVCFPTDYAHHGFEVTGEDNRGTPRKSGGPQMAPWTEGAWMTKHAGTYYLQYSAPGTQFKSYADGVYTSTNPMGPFVYAPYSPFSHKPTGFIGGAGHSSTVQDDRGNYWHISTMPIAVRHMFERRLGLFPLGFTSDGQMYCNTYLGDYPQFVPGVSPDPARNNSPGWMLLSYDKPATASSTLDDFAARNAFDENIRTWWSATTGTTGQWLRVDLGKVCRVEAIQVNFADQGATQFGRLRNDFYRYYVEASKNGHDWAICLDRRDNLRDAPHDYAQLEAPVAARYLRLVSLHSPAGGLFSVSGFRIFGRAPGNPPPRVRGVTASRNVADGRVVRVSWAPVKEADFYIIRYGIARDRLFNNYQVYGTARFNINSLNTGVTYYLTVDAVNGSGITRGTVVREVP
jgi:xylan 1,4-beta-xylosidase